MAITSPLGEGSTELLPSLPREIALYFRDELRSARASALRNAEAFEEVIFVFERLGIYLTKKVSGLSDYGNKIAEIAKRSTQAANSEVDPQQRQPDFHRLYKIVKDARNDAMHVGAYARHLTTSSVELAVVLEDALMSNSYLVQDFMVKNPICAFIWQPLGLVRQTMLANSFSYLPVQEKPNGSWSWLSDFELARLLRSASSGNQRKELLALTLEEALRTHKLGIDPAETCSPDETIGDAIAKSEGVTDHTILPGLARLFSGEFLTVEPAFPPASILWNGPRRQGFASPRNTSAPLTAPGRSSHPPHKAERRSPSKRSEFDKLAGDYCGALQEGKPILVTSNRANDLIGIITAFDML